MSQELDRVYLDFLLAHAVFTVKPMFPPELCARIYMILMGFNMTWMGFHMIAKVHINMTSSVRTDMTFLFGRRTSTPASVRPQAVNQAQTT